MNHHPRTLAFGFAIVWSAAMVAPIRAQVSDAAATFYADGVDSFFAGRADEAAASLSRSIDANPNDPRAFYFRALARLRIGDSGGAQDDMRAGAQVEARLPNRYAIGKSLERVQGYDRLELEKYRRTARMNVVTTAKPIVPVSDQQPIAEPDAAVLRERRMVPLDGFMQPGTPKLVPVPEAAQATTTAASAPIPNSAAPAAAATSEGDPFADDATKAKAAQAKAATTVDSAAKATTVIPAKPDALATPPAAAASETDPFDEAASKSQPTAPAKAPPEGAATPKKAAAKTDAPLSGKVDATKATPPAKAAAPKLPPQSKDAGDAGNPFDQ